MAVLHYGLFFRGEMSKTGPGCVLGQDEKNLTETARLLASFLPLGREPGDQVIE